MNIVKTLPQGNYRPKSNNYYGAYNTSALTLGPQLINLEQLTSDKYGSILSNETFNKVIEKNKETQEKDLVNFENTVLDNSPFDNALKEAYKNFKNSDNSNIKKLKDYGFLIRHVSPKNGHWEVTGGGSKKWQD